MRRRRKRRKEELKKPYRREQKETRKGGRETGQRAAWRRVKEGGKTNDTKGKGGKMRVLTLEDQMEWIKKGKKGGGGRQNR